MDPPALFKRPGARRRADERSDCGRTQRGKLAIELFHGLGELLLAARMFGRGALPLQLDAREPEGLDPAHLFGIGVLARSSEALPLLFPLFHPLCDARLRINQTFTCIAHVSIIPAHSGRTIDRVCEPAAEKPAFGPEWKISCVVTLRQHRGDKGMIPPFSLVSIATAVGAAFIMWLILVVFFTPGINYHAKTRLEACSPEFAAHLLATSQAVLYHGNRIEILTNGANFYPIMLRTIKDAEHSINLECYIFRPGRIADQFIDALAERAKAGVLVTITADAIGSPRLGRSRLRHLRDAGCRVEFYQPIRWYRLARLNNRTHRELLIVDGRVAFVGGAGIADCWGIADGESKPWRDTMARVQGPVVAALQGVVGENWLECCGEILIGDKHFPTLSRAGDTMAFVVKSSPSDRATVSRVVFQMLIDSACTDVMISTPYFLPDRALRCVLIETARRGVRLSVVLPGTRTDQRWVRLASRRNYGILLEAGARIFEYEGAMIHCKALLVDGLWAVLGTTNVDNRSFEHNDEVNLVMRDEPIAGRLAEDYRKDVAASREITLEAWRERSRWEKLIGTVAWVLERQQ